MDEFEDGETFHGFAEDDELRTSVQNKLQKIKRLTNDTVQTDHATVRQPIRRFLRRSESLPLPGVRARSFGVARKPAESNATVNMDTSTPSIPSNSLLALGIVMNEDKKEASKTVSTTAVPLTSKLPDSGRKRNFLTKIPLKTPVKKPETLGRAVEDKPLPILSPAPQTAAITDIHKVKPNLIRMVTSQPSVPIIETGLAAVESQLEMDLDQLEDCTIESSNQPAEDQQSTVTSDVSIKPSNENPLEEDKKDNICKTDTIAIGDHGKTFQLKNMPAIEPVNISKVTNEKKVEINTPAKKIPSKDVPISPPLRSKRAKVPNRRFFPEDSPPQNKSVLMTPTSSPQKSPKKVVKSPPLPSASNTKKKRSISMTDCQSTNGKLSKLDSDVNVNHCVVGNKPHITPVAATNALATDISNSNQAELGGRPRRTIIPNRKFLSEDDEPSKDIQFVTKNTDFAESKKPYPAESTKKRQKSEKLAHANGESSAQPLNNATTVVNKINAKASKAKNFTDCDPNAMTASKDETTIVKEPQIFVPQIQCNGNGITINAVINGTESDNKPAVDGERALVNIDQDELLVNESEMKLLKGNPIFFGTCIVRTSDSENGKTDEHHHGRLICCGVCCQIKKYRLPHEKKSRDSFLCTDCNIIVNKIFKVALDSKSFACITGPPICAGWCPLVHSPLDQFCQACFAKACLKNLPIDSSVYFKIWRSIPPMSRGGVTPLVPVSNASSPYIGKVVYIDDTGAITSTTDCLEVITPIDTHPDVSDVANNEDLNTARFIAVQPQQAATDASSKNCENVIPIQNPHHSSSLLPTMSHNSVDKCNGVSTEEMLLGRQIGQERVETLVDPILKPEVDSVEIFGFPVIVSGSSYPRKPLCFLCGSSGIEQLIFCSMCCEPYHPFCSGDDLLLDTYIARWNNEQNRAGGIEEPFQNSENEDSSKIVLKWTCRRCLPCKTCGDAIGSKELIRCNRCQNPFHLNSCIDKTILNKVKDLTRLRKVWTCDTCLKCKSCDKKIESNRRIQTIQQAAAAVKSDEEEEEEDGYDEDESSSNVSSQSQPSCLMLCLDCFKQRKKGSFCPICEVCYDDNDWDSKMMECSVCNRWIHSTCENLNVDQYNVLGKLPDYIEYVCRLCHTNNGAPLWLDAVNSQLMKECSSALRLFERKALGLGSLSRKRSSVSVDGKPSFVCKLFEEEGNSARKPEEHETMKNTDIVAATDPADSILSRLRKSVRETVTSQKDIISCQVKLRDFVMNPKNVEENWYALKILGVEVLNDATLPQEVEEEDTRVPGTPIYKTPAMPFAVLF